MDYFMTDEQMLHSLLGLKEVMASHGDTGYLPALDEVIAELRRRNATKPAGTSNFPNEYLKNSIQRYIFDGAARDISPYNTATNILLFLAAQPASPLRGMDRDLIALDAAHQIEALPSDLRQVQRTARIQCIVLDALSASSEQPAAAPVTGLPTPEQIEPILDDFLGVDDPHYEELRRRCAQRIFDLCAVTSGLSIKPSDNKISSRPDKDAP